MRVVLLRHGECLGNVDESAYTRIPDHALALTAHGEAQATAAGPRIKELLGDARFGVYVSPYRRTLHTLALLGVDPVWTVQEPRLREQDWGNLQDPDGQRRHREERDFFGHFFYRLPNGESGADVDDRIAAFLTELRLAPPDAEALLVVTHGLAMRLLARRALGGRCRCSRRCPTPSPAGTGCSPSTTAAGASTARSPSGGRPRTARRSSGQLRSNTSRAHASRLVSSGSASR